MDEVGARRRLIILRNSRTGKKGAITKRIARLDGMVEAGGCGRRFMREMMEKLVVAYQEFEQVCTEINQLLTLFDEVDELNGIEEVRLNVDECVALVTEHLDSRADEAPSSSSSARTLSWVAQLPLPSHSDVSESDSRVSFGSDHSRSHHVDDPGKTLVISTPLSTSFTPVENVQTKPASGQDESVQAYGLADVSGVTPTSENLTVSDASGTVLIRVPPEDPSGGPDLNANVSVSALIPYTNMQDSVGRDISAPDISGVNNPEYVPGLNVLARPWDEVKLNTSSELAPGSDRNANQGIGRIEALMRQPLFPWPQGNIPDRDLGILVTRPPLEKFSAGNEAGSHKLRPTGKSFNQSGTNLSFRLCYRSNTGWCP